MISVRGSRRGVSSTAGHGCSHRGPEVQVAMASMERASTGHDGLHGEEGRWEVKMGGCGKCMREMRL